MNTRRIAARTLELAGWKYEGPVPTEPKFVMLAVPHTSNWDGALLVLLTRSIGLEIQWMVKDAWIKGALGPAMRGLGAVGVDRSRRQNLVEQMIEQFGTRDRFALAIPPEGTRSRVPYWKSGFYHIALGARVPVVPGYLDFARKRGGLGPAIQLTGNPVVDMDVIRAFYARMNPTPCVPENFGPIRLREEDETK
ncbi:MAG: lysophospholipid acyltransferase family protein [Deltaproteobacteria bacterium]